MWSPLFTLNDQPIVSQPDFPLLTSKASSDSPHLICEIISTSLIFPSLPCLLHTFPGTPGQDKPRPSSLSAQANPEQTPEATIWAPQPVSDSRWTGGWNLKFEEQPIGAWTSWVFSLLISRPYYGEAQILEPKPEKGHILHIRDPWSKSLEISHQKHWIQANSGMTFFKCSKKRTINP